MKTIYLIGFMGAGKTTIGKILAEQLDLPVIDTDELIESNEKMTINEIFSVHGEPFFRKKETDVLQSIATNNYVVTTGGGIILNDDNRTWMREHGHVVFLYCQPDEILRRLKDDSTRPLLQENKAETLFNLYNERLETYELSSHITVDTTNKEIIEIVKEIVTSLD